MPDLFPESLTNIDAQIAEAERELRMRENVYPRWVPAGRLPQQIADDRIAVQKAIIETLHAVKRAGGVGQ